MDLDVVGVAVSAVRVVDRHHVGTESANDGDEATDGIVEVGLPEAVGMQVRVLAHHSRVAVAEEDVVLDPEDGHRRRHLLGAYFGETRLDRLGIVVVVDLPFGAVGGSHHHGRPAGSGRGGEYPTGLDHLVVGVGME